MQSQQTYEIEELVWQALGKVLSSCHGALLRGLRARDAWTCAFARDVLMRFTRSYERENLLSTFVPFVYDLENFEDVVVSTVVPDFNELRLRDLRRIIKSYRQTNGKGGGGGGGGGL